MFLAAQLNDLLDLDVLVLTDQLQDLILTPVGSELGTFSDIDFVCHPSWYLVYEVSEVSVCYFGFLEVRVH